MFEEIYKVLRPGGRVIISVEHPIITSNFANLSEGRRTTWLVDNYFNSGARKHMWLGSEVTKYHHTLEEYFNFVTDAGFELMRVRSINARHRKFCERSRI